MGRWTRIEESSLYLIPPPVDEDMAGLYAINPKAKNTVFVYKKREVAAKWGILNIVEDVGKDVEIINKLLVIWSGFAKHFCTNESAFSSRWPAEFSPALTDSLRVSHSRYAFSRKSN